LPPLHSRPIRAVQALKVGTLVVFLCTITVVASWASDELFLADNDVLNGDIVVGFATGEKA
jgi:hypothetical protein